MVVPKDPVLTAHESDPQRASSQRLDGWKEISQYLGRNVRTSQRWERELQLPVRRVGTNRGASVFALRSEIDAWLSAQSFSAEPEPDVAPSERTDNATETKPSEPSQARTDTPVSAPSLSSKRLLLLSACFVIVLIALLTAARLRTPTPTDCRVEDNALVVTGSDGRELWRRHFPSIQSSPRGRRITWIGDLSGYGRNEVLYAHYPAEPSQRDPIALYCFSANGKELWRFIPGHTVRTADQTFEPPFEIQTFEVVSQNARNYVVVNSHHFRYFPDQVAILSPGGHLLREYWHAGPLTRIGVGDLNHDGRPELYLSGIDDQYHLATLVMLDLEGASGASAQTDRKYQFMDMPFANERAKVFFRRSCINRALEKQNEAADIRFGRENIWVSVLEKHGAGAEIASVDYDLTPNLELKQVSLPDQFAVVHEQLERRGILDHHLSAKEIEPLKNIKQP